MVTRHNITADVMGVSEVLLNSNLSPYSLFRRYNSKTRITQNSTLLLLPVPDHSASQSYLSSCDAQCLSSLFLNEFTEGAVTTEVVREVAILHDTITRILYGQLLNYYY